ncbi:MAG: hypothetical protein ACFE9Q_17545 [Candidatus Hodarchaeota archaeon]
MTFATIGIVLLLFSTSVQATTTIRPIEDWAGENIVGWADPVSGFAIYPHAVEWCFFGPNWPFNFLDWEHKLVWECQYEGFIQERVIDEEHTLITINIHVKEVPFMIFYPNSPGYIYYPPIYNGTMEYYFQCRILFNTESLYNILEVGKIPSLFEILGAGFGFWPYPDEPVPELTYTHFVGEGYITEGGEGTVEVNQVGFLNPATGEFIWPVESVIIE